MKEFAESIPSAGKQERLLKALHGRKAYRRFKDEIINLDVEKAYYAYRFLALCRIARQWCEENKIPYSVRKAEK